MTERERRVLHGDRPIDIDILLYGASVVRTKEVEIPHLRMAERRFVLVPLAEIAPGAVHPVLKKTIAELLHDLPAGQAVRKVKTV